MNIDDFLQHQKLIARTLMNGGSEPFFEEELYTDIQNDNLKYIFSVLHCKLNYLLDFMNDKSQINRHYNADESRELNQVIEIYRDTEHFLRDSKYSFSMSKEYEKVVELCENFLSNSGGSEIPGEYEKIEIKKYDSIFKLNKSISVKNNLTGRKLADLHLIGSGSYANVYKYKDTNYNQWFAVKKMKKDLLPDEVVRFKEEYKVMADLHSPYILHVYRYDEDNEQYVMELADSTLLKYLEKNPTICGKKRRSIALQVLSGFRYLHSRGFLHRDISFSNVLVFQYEDTIVVKISDLGLVKKQESILTNPSTDMVDCKFNPNFWTNLSA